MAYDFFINKNSTLPNLRMEVINNGRNNFHKLYTALQSADVYFTMVDVNTGVKRIVNASANVVERENGGCDDEYVIEYKWKERDTKVPGIYRGQFRIVFDSTNTSSEDGTLPVGELIVPIAEELIIHINDGCIKKSITPP